ncbi:connectin [Bombyx mori]|uniref:Connectin n=1 Tax=Bombyx mori TaxID=7091 RepID=A0A8R1WNS6_BOMMO|nr:connectin [Bombyx mori]
MEQVTKYLIIIASVMTVKLTVTESKNDTKPRIDRRYFHVPMFVNICDIEDRRSKVHCYCDNNKPKMATRADCWVFGGGITEDDPIWPNFSSQSELEHLIFNARSDDALTFIPAKAIVRLDKLKHVTIQFGTIKRIPPYAFTNSSTLRQIVLKSTKITKLEKHAFSRLMMLSNLSLDDNQIEELKRESFYNLPNLHILHLSNNNISLIHEGCFKHLNNLIELRLDYNYISVVTREMFEGLENLSKLNLRHNKLTMIGNLAFTELWGLKELMLDNNAIEYISERAFGGLAQLRKLWLSGNRLTTFYEDALEDMRSLVVLDLRNNLLETISYEAIRPLVENVKSSSAAVYLEGNPLDCNCRLSWIYVLRNETQESTLRHALEKVSCIQDPESDRHLNDHVEATNAKDNVLADENYDYYDRNDDYGQRNKFKTNNAVKLLDIPLDTLPCPKDLLQSVEESYGHPVQNEIRLKAFSGGSFLYHRSLLIALPLLFL